MSQSSTQVTSEAVLHVLRGVNDPELNRSLVELGMIQDVKVCGGSVSLTVVLTTPACPLRAQIENDVKSAVRTLPGIESVELKITANVSKGVRDGSINLAGIKNVVAVASGKGGVGKSTVSANLSIALARHGARVGLLDSDVYGPNIPLMMGITHAPQPEGDRLKPAVAFSIKVMSMGFFVKEGEAVIWRGPMLHGAVRQFLGEVSWGDLDYLVVDLPPGTGDVQLSLSQSISMTGAVIVSTPQDVALQDVRKGIAMFRKVGVPILGIIENMSGHVCSKCGNEDFIFGHGGAQHEGELQSIPFLGSIPIDTSIRIGGDSGKPIVADKPDSPISRRFMDVAAALAGSISRSNFAQQAMLMPPVG
ncbi:MAG: Mrp/NBP35 family ATP-binding protein [Candidatus Wallbacteria bacterium]|nr:Mrp/NBP35 family ATP-binding protein [Candidatus Wallbacteria bacterium]